MMRLSLKTIEQSQITHILHRLRRYPHNQITESDRMMAGEMLNGGNRKLTFFVLVVLLLSSIPLMPTTAADEGNPA